MKKDIASELKFNARYVSGAAVDRAGYDGLSLVLPVAATTAVALTHSDNDSDYTDVGADYIANNDAGTLAGNDVTYGATGSGNIGYLGNKRYVKFTVSNAVATSSLITVLAPLKVPTAS